MTYHTYLIWKQGKRILLDVHLLLFQGELHLRLVATSPSDLGHQVLFDILPLRVVPPIMFGGIVYGFVGLVPTVASFWKFMLILVLFNLTTAVVVLFLSIAIASTSVAGLAGTLVMLFKCVSLRRPNTFALTDMIRSLMFTGLLINRESVPVAFQWLHTISFFHAAFEALAVNELRYLHLTETKVCSPSSLTHSTSSDIPK
jgi:hypothetical protein